VVIQLKKAASAAFLLAFFHYLMPISAKTVILLQNSSDQLQATVGGIYTKSQLAFLPNNRYI